MEVDLGEAAKDKALNRRVALTVVLLSVVMGLGNIKDGNIVQAMQQAQSDAVDGWSQYQATRMKIRIVETAQAQITATAPSATGQIARLATESARYATEAPRLATQARAASARYDALNVHDDQFDASEALLSTAISVAAVAALAESGWLLVVGWLFGACGLFMALCGFAGWGFHPDILSNLLG